MSADGQIEAEEDGGGGAACHEDMQPKATQGKHFVHSSFCFGQMLETWYMCGQVEGGGWGAGGGGGQ